MSVLRFFLLDYRFGRGRPNRLDSAVLGDGFTGQNNRLISGRRTKVVAFAARPFTASAGMLLGGRTRLVTWFGRPLELLLWSLLKLLSGLLLGLARSTTTPATATSTPATHTFTFALLFAAA